MKIQVDIFTGFLSSGKTSLIKQLLYSGMYNREKILIIQCEAGEEELQDEFIKEKNILIERIGKDKLLEAGYIKEAIKKHTPGRIIIEQNGMTKLQELLIQLDEGSVRKLCSINGIVNVIDCRTFDLFMSNIGSNMVDRVENSDLVVLNYMEEVSKKQMETIKRTIKALNKTGEIVSIAEPEDFRKALEDGIAYSEEDETRIKKPSDKLFMIFILAILSYLIISVLRSVEFNLSTIDLSGFQVFTTIFASILMQALPFLLIGVLVSSVIQVFVTSEMVVKYFPKSRVLSFGMAILAGLFFPVCDCAIVPVASRFVKKGVPLHAVVTFILVAPIVNPIVIASTLYAFPGEPSIMFYRLYLGVTIALAAGITFLFFPEEENVRLEGANSYLCGCAYCTGYENYSGWTQKFAAIFKHAGEEMFDVGRFLIAGAFLTSVLQVMIPKELISGFQAGNTMSLIIMMGVGLVLSVCSSSDAFIARSFANQFSMGSIMGFLVLGPMIDIKNILMLTANFKKRFVFKFVFVVIGLAFSVLYFFSAVMF